MKAQDDGNQYVYDDTTKTNKLKVDIMHMLTKCIFTEDVDVNFWIKGDNGLKEYITIYKNEHKVNIPVDSNIKLYCGEDNIDYGAHYKAGLDGFLTYKGNIA